MFKQRFLAILSLAAIVLGSAGLPAALADSASAGTDYLVQTGDWLAKIAQEAYGGYRLYPAVVLATNKLAASDPSYATIADPFVIEPGFKLFVPAAADARASLTVTALESAEYTSEWATAGVARLTNGAYDAEIAPGSASRLTIQLLPHMAFGYTAAGHSMAVVTLATNSGGSGTFVDLAVLVDDGTRLLQLAGVSLGDRGQVQALAVNGQEIRVTLLTQGPDDPMCCPTQRQTRRFVLAGDPLALVEEATPAWLGTTWEWLAATGGASSQMTVSDPSRYTLSLAADGSAALRVDCNRAFGTYAWQGQDLTVAVQGMTRAACPADSLSDAYLDRLALVSGWELADGQLQLALADGGTMVFRPVATAAE